MTTHPTRFRVQRLSREISLIFGASTMLALPMALAAPQGGTVTEGQASIVNNGALTTITQGTQRAAIDWRSFNVGANETVNFVQPNASAAILNRVVGNDPSAIFGRITGNGQVLLINPNGIVFGRTAQVDVGALTATTSNLSNAEFMAGRLNFTEPGKPGATVENQGRITVAEGGFVALVGRQVANSGVINARLGKVALAGGDAFVLDLYGDKLVNLIVDPAAMNALTDAQGQPLAARVDHSGEIVAEGGRVQLSVATVKQLVDNLINLSGVVRATSFTNAAGVISLQGDANTRVTVSGALDTSGSDRGGRIEATGREVNLQSGATLAAAGGQGSIAIGGDWQGRGALAHADNVNVAPGATLDASGGTNGDGGTVVLWSDKNTQFAGRIDANGGTASGNAGQVEVSSKGTLGFQGDVGVFSTNGNQGSLLLDPLNLTIAATSSGDSHVSADQIRYFLTRGTNVTLSADQNVTVNAEVNGLVTGGGGVPGGGLTLTAGNNLAVNQSIVLNNGALNLTATNGTLSQANGTVLYTGTGAATLRGGAGVDLGQLLSGGVVDIRSASGGVTVRNALVSATANGSPAPVGYLQVFAAGPVRLNGALVDGNINVRSSAGVTLANGTVESRNGDIQVQAGSDITSTSANIGLVSTRAVSATAGGSIDLGVVVGTESVSLDTDTGNLTVRQAITGAGGAASGRVGVRAAGALSLAGVNAGALGLSIGSTSGDVTSRGATSSEGGLLSAGSISVSAAGRAGTAATPLNLRAMGDIAVEGQSGVDVATVLGRGSIRLQSDMGGVTVRNAIGAEPGAITESTVLRPDRITLSAFGDVDFAGAAVGTNGLSVSSTGGSVTLRNSSVFSSGPVSMLVQGQNSITLGSGAGIATTTSAGGVGLSSQNGNITVGNGGVRVRGEDAGVTLSSTGGSLLLNGDIQTSAGTIHLISQTGNVIAQSSNGADSALNATLDAGRDTTRSVILVTTGGTIELGELIAQSRVDLWSTNGNVTLKRGLGGSSIGTANGVSNALLTTGYVDYASGYQSQYRPNVGRLIIRADLGSVELNGLNLDGNANATDSTAGLSVTAGRRIVSNNEIAVNKGDIVLAGGTTQATDGVYLGSSVYSRGYDVVSGGTHTKTGYGIRVTGRVLGMFDNTNEMAQLPVNTYVTSWYTVDSNSNPIPHQVRTDAGGFVVDAAGVRVRNSDGSFQMLALGATNALADLTLYNVNANAVIVSGPNTGATAIGVRGVGSVLDSNNLPVVVQQQIAKIEIANNVANYQDTNNQRTLVEANTGSAASRRIELGTSTMPITIAGVANQTPQTAMRITGATPVLIAPSLTPVDATPAQNGATAATVGIGLKLLSFRESGDTGSQVWASTVRMINSGDSNNFFFRLTGTGNALSVTDLTTTAPVEGVFTVTAPALATRTYTLNGNLVTEVAQLSTGTATYTFRIEDSAGGEIARLLTVSTPVNANLGSLSNTAPGGATGVSAWSFTTWRNANETGKVRLEPPQLSVAGVASGMVINGGLYGRDGSTGSALQTGGTVSPNYTLMQVGPRQEVPFQNLVSPNQFSDPRTFQIDRILVDSQSTNGLVGTRVFAYDGVIDTSNGSRTFDGNTGVAIPGLNGIGGFNNSTVGFAGIGAGFGSLGNGTAGSTGVAGTSGQGVGGATIPGGQSGTGTAPPVPPQAVEDRSTQDVGTLPTATAGTGAGSELVFSTSIAAEADMGRGGAVPGSAVNVFKRLYRLATSSSPGVCAPGVVQQTATDGGTARDCAAK